LDIEQLGDGGSSGAIPQAGLLQGDLSFLGRAGGNPNALFCGAQESRGLTDLQLGL
jgi:hypothetical protein